MWPIFLEKKKTMSNERIQQLKKKKKNKHNLNNERMLKEGRDGKRRPKDLQKSEGAT